MQQTSSHTLAHPANAERIQRRLLAHNSLHEQEGNMVVFEKEEQMAQGAREPLTPPLLSPLHDHSSCIVQVLTDLTMHRPDHTLP